MRRLAAGLTILACSVATALWLTSKQPTRLRAPSSLVASESTSTKSEIPPSFRADSAVTARESPVLPEAHEWSVSLCPVGMVWVGGRFCPNSRDQRVHDARCAAGERTVAVCMDPHEYPSQFGVRPAVMLDFASAAAACRAERKRLCSESEWTFACQSTRDASACNANRTELTIRTGELAKADRVSAEIAKYEGRRPNGENACVNDFRVFDLLGNVQEWVASEHRTPHVGALKGGRYNQSSIGCGRSIYVSDPWTRYPHTGLRCCADPLAPAPTTP